MNDFKLKETAQIIKNGGIAVFPTETVYGIGVNGLDENSIKKLFEAKKRPFNKPISLLVNNIEMIEKVSKNISKQEYALIKTFMPGPLTIILKKKDILPNILTADLDTVGIRIPANNIALDLIKYTGIPIATSSANISGEACYPNIEDIKNRFGNSVDYYLDGTTNSINLPSTIVQIIDGIPHILREGSISKEQIISVLKHV